MSEPWITQEVVEMIFQIDLRDRCSCSIWSYQTIFQRSSIQLLSTSSRKDISTPKLTESSKIYQNPPSNFGIKLNRLCYPLQPNSITFSTWEKSQEFSKEFWESPRMSSWSQHTWKTLNLKSFWSDFGDMNVKECLLIN